MDLVEAQARGAARWPNRVFLGSLTARALGDAIRAARRADVSGAS